MPRSFGFDGLQTASRGRARAKAQPLAAEILRIGRLRPNKTEKMIELKKRGALLLRRSPALFRARICCLSAAPGCKPRTVDGGDVRCCWVRRRGAKAASIMLEATELGLGSVWICFFKPDIIKEEFQLPDSLEPINILAIGYADEASADPERHLATRIPLGQLVSYEKLD